MLFRIMTAIMRSLYLATIPSLMWRTIVACAHGMGQMRIFRIIYGHIAEKIRHDLPYK
jgi:hypothetical protein